MSNLKIFILLNLLLFISSCGTVKNAFTNQKKNSSDEFLVEKKSPLVMPPNYGELPVPDTNSNDSNQNTDKNKIENLILNKDNTSLQNNNDTSNQNLEKSILNKIKNKN